MLQLVNDDDGKPAAPDPGAIPGLNQAVSAEGGVKYAIDVGGQGEALMALNMFQKAADWDQSPRTICEVRRQSLTDMQSMLERFVAPGGTGEYMGREKERARLGLAQLLAYQGRMDEAIAQFQLVYDDAKVHDPAVVPQMAEAVGVAYLHRAEMTNGVYTEPADRCLLSPKGLIAPLSKTDDAVEAIRYFESYLAKKPDELEVKWLLNIAYMMTGRYPNGVPEAYRIPPSAFVSSEDIGRFVDVAAALGLSTVRPAGGVIIDDFDNDGRLDIATSTQASCTAMQLLPGKSQTVPSPIGPRRPASAISSAA